MLLKDKTKKSGILLAISSLPSKHGIGSFDKEAYRFVDFLNECRQSYWQILPLCPVGKGNSPYSSYSAFAGEILYIDLEKLEKQGLLKEIPYFEETIHTDYKKVKKFKLPLLKKAAENFNIKDKNYISFCENNSFWLENFALFMAIKEKIGEIPFSDWEDGLKYKLPEEIKKFSKENIESIKFYKITQYLFYEQYKKLKEYANKKGIKIIGDIPFYVSPDSADVWGNPECFMLDSNMKPTLIAGVPPDIFSSSGQLWGNPIYNWSHQKSNDYYWWQERLTHNSELYDVLRIDHFRAFADYYEIDANATDAKNGKWKNGMGIDFWEKVKSTIKECEIIAEDLGGETPKVQSLIKETGFPNMKILQFAFDSDLSDPFLPENFEENCVCYTGTHDNDTTLGWYEKADKKEKLLFENLIEKNYESPVFRLISAGMNSAANIVIIPLQDYMELDDTHRMNIPGKEEGNWQWRFCSDDINEELINTVLSLSKNRN